MMNSIDWGDLFDAGLFIGALLEGDPRHAEALPLVEAARKGEIMVCTTSGIISEVYGQLTWHMASPPHSPAQAAEVITRRGNHTTPGTTFAYSNSAGWPQRGAENNGAGFSS